MPSQHVLQVDAHLLQSGLRPDLEGPVGRFVHLDGDGLALQLPRAQPPLGEPPLASSCRRRASRISRSTSLPGAAPWASRRAACPAGSGRRRRLDLGLTPLHQQIDQPALRRFLGPAPEPPRSAPARPCGSPSPRDRGSCSPRRAPRKPTSVYFVASTFMKGALARLARRRAISVFPTPVAPIMRMFLGMDLVAQLVGKAVGGGAGCAARWPPRAWRPPGR